MLNLITEIIKSIMLPLVLCFSSCVTVVIQLRVVRKHELFVQFSTLHVGVDAYMYELVCTSCVKIITCECAQIRSGVLIFQYMYPAE